MEFISSTKMDGAKMSSEGVMAGDFGYIDVKFCADYESVLPASIRCLVFALSSKEGTIAIISRQNDPFFRYKNSALRKGIEIEQNRIAPRERASKSTSRTTRAGTD